MPNTSSTKKRMRQNELRRTRNRATKSVLKTQVRRVRDAIGAGNLAGAETEFRAAAKKLDKAVAAGVIHLNVSARVKSRLSAAMKQAKQKVKA